MHTMPVSDINDDNIDQVNALVLLDDEGFDWFRDLNKVVNLLRRRNIPTIVANTDLAYPRSANDVSIAIGGIATMIETIVGKKFIRFGKPDSQMFMFAYDLVREKLSVNKKDILMVGDTLKTDILGGNKFGLDTVLVFTGNTLAADAEIRMATTGIVQLTFAIVPLSIFNTLTKPYRIKKTFQKVKGFLLLSRFVEKALYNGLPLGQTVVKYKVS